MAVPGQNAGSLAAESLSSPTILPCPHALGGWPWASKLGLGGGWGWGTFPKADGNICLFSREGCRH